VSYLEIAQAAARRAEARRELDQVVPPLPSPEAEARRRRLLAKLRELPGLAYAVETEQMPDGSHVLALAIPGATCEVAVPIPRDPFEFARDLIEAMDRTTARDRSDKSDKRGR